ncbi:MAG TPA: DUF6008 family protein [Acidimicrobiia bacterium]|jgi:hypothetical protein
MTRAFKYLAVAALTFQGVHFVEHVAQLGYWLLHPAEAPWITPWALPARDALAVAGEVPLGNELLHLVGNLVFLGGLMALAIYWNRRGGEASPHLRTALWVQGIHMGEHLALTATTVIFGKAAGLSTFLGLISGPAMTSFRVWFHLLINLVATWYAGRALLALHSKGLLVEPKSRTQPAASVSQS